MIIHVKSPPIEHVEVIVIMKLKSHWALFDKYFDDCGEQCIAGRLSALDFWSAFNRAGLELQSWSISDIYERHLFI